MNFILDKNGESYYMYETGTLEPVRKYWGIKSKIYRQTFSRNEAVVKDMRKDAEAVYPSFRFPHFIDVTRLYSGKRARKLNIPREKLFHKVSEAEVVYLCSPAWMDWEPIAWAHPGENDVSSNCLFISMGGSFRYRIRLSLMEAPEASIILRVRMR